MGLDMYLWKKSHIDIYDFKKEDWEAKKIKVSVDIEFADGEVKTVKYEQDNPTHSGELLLPVAYWRKANQIHKWILDHTKQEKDDCHKIWVSASKIKELIQDCKTVLADHSKAEELLPTQDGFFFGDTQYDEYYFQDLEETIKMLGEVNDGDEFVYQASW